MRYSIYIIKSKPKYFPIYNNSTLENPSIDRFQTGIFDFVELYFPVDVSRAQKFQSILELYIKTSEAVIFNYLWE